MRLFLDTNILLDIVEQRMPFFTASQAVLDECDRQGHEIFIAWHGAATVFYITARKRGESFALQMVRDLLNWATVATAGQGEAVAALGYGIADFEDAFDCFGCGSLWRGPADHSRCCGIYQESSASNQPKRIPPAVASQLTGIRNGGGRVQA